MSDIQKLLEAKLPTDQFVDLLRQLIGETKFLQNSPPKLVPEESRAADHVLEYLKEYTKEVDSLKTKPEFDEDKPLLVHRVEYAPKRTNLLIEYPGRGSSDQLVSFVGSHFDVVAADASAWEKDPFVLEVGDDGTLYGRGTTDCLGHVTLVSVLLRYLAETKPKLDVGLLVVFIADEETGSGHVGVPELARQGELARLKNGPVYWVDCADKHPNVGSGGVVGWKLTVSSELCHSGFPNKTVNPIELASDFVREVQRIFYAMFGKHAREEEYGFECSSSLKPTQITCPEGSRNQIPQSCTIEGDIRLIPFYQIEDAIAAVDTAVAGLKADKFKELTATSDGARGRDSKYVTDDLTPKVDWEWIGTPVQGIACSLSSDGFEVLAEATTEIIGFCRPLADTGSLPLVADLQRQGCDVQTVGYGVEDAYHANNEFARLGDYEEGYQVLMRVLFKQNERCVARK
eukprot:TRINITY_DN14866_c0_g1_i1.p1 TRINITY_DN14866_c0_g1~~TRINITY_DN14866_c0_g1_i1.p1  ORF type:complete len:469 (-),score=91.82 TRINITY_DN14866_c0_g1_i1:62-1438(-)